MNEIPFLLTGKSVRKFKEVDPFNPSNTIEGYLCRTADMKYGMLYINIVNGKPAHTIVWATPKMGYPFDREGNWRQPCDIRETIRVFEKLDGTNILGYTYKDAEGNEFVTFKTRFRPVLGEGQYGDFLSLWREMIDVYPEIPELPLKYGCNVSHELYGKRNKVLVEYDTKLDTRILFGRQHDGSVTIPDIFEGCGIPVVLQIREISKNDDFVEAYRDIEEYLNEHLIVDKEIVDGKEKIKMVTGLEGTVWYVVNDDYKTIQYKAKPKVIFDLHTTAGGIPKHSIYITCINAFEDTDKPDYEYVVELLKEEYEESDIYKKTYTIKKILEDVRFEKQLRHEVVEDYNKHEIFNISKDKGTVMRWFAQHYDKKMCGKIFTLLWNEFGV